MSFYSWLTYVIITTLNEFLDLIMHRHSLEFIKELEKKNFYSNRKKFFFLKFLNQNIIIHLFYYYY